MPINISAIPESDLRRFAACWLNSELTTDWERAHASFDPEGKVKLASFKAVTHRVSKKAYSGGGSAAAATGDGAEEPAPAKKAAGKRKKAVSEANEDVEAQPAPKPKRGRPAGKKGPKTRSSEEKVVEDEDLGLKSEDGDEE